MRYAGFSDEVVSDGTQFFGRSASDGLLAVGYDTTKRLVLADRHGDIVAGFDPTDTTLSAGLPDTRTYDPFGQSTNATGLKYRVGYQGDWTDPRSGDVNQGARWYNPSTATFNSRDTITHNAGATSSVQNLYTYAGGNPLTYNDPDGRRPIDPGGGSTNCTRDLSKVIGWMWAGEGSDSKTPIYGVKCDPPKPPPPPVKPECPGSKDCEPKCRGGGKNCPPPITDCKKNCDPPPPTRCKKDCGPKPPPPPVCDPQCQLNKKIKNERDQLEQDAQNVNQPPPGDPVCASGNPLCPTNPTTPATIVGPQGDLTNETSAWSDQQYKDALNKYGSVISSVGTTGDYNWFNMGIGGGLSSTNNPACEVCAGGGAGGWGGGRGGAGGGSRVIEPGGGGSGKGGRGGLPAIGEPGCGCTPQIGSRVAPPGRELLYGQELPTGVGRFRVDPSGVATDIRPLGRGSTGRALPESLSEQVAMKSAMSNPGGGRALPIRMTDPRWPAESGWVKMSQNVNGVEIHYVANTRTGQVDDFKFK
nr:RHS repeat-associated core domain-containing protein [Kribbella solani]